MQTPTSGLSQTIELSIAPVFLLSAVGVFLGVLTNRLARIVDRARALDHESDAAREERAVLETRKRLILQAVNMCTYSAVLIASVIAALFLGAFVRLDLTGVVGWAFVGAMLTLIVGLLNFLREVRLALRWVRKGGGPGIRA
jgi:hypothetical protein